MLLSDGKHLTGFYFVGQKYEPTNSEDWQEKADLPVFKQFTAELDEYLAGVRHVFETPYHFPAGTPFQQKVWRAIAKVPYGKTSSYLQLAHDIKSPTSVRAVGGAVGKNPLSIIVPCHRIIGSDGSLTGFAGGLGLKKKILAIEGFST